MHQLRKLADEGRVVMVVTHSVLALDVCDNVLVLALGGRMAYFGPPAGVLEHFGCRNYPQVFDLLDEPDLWQRIPPPPVATGGHAPAQAGPGAAPPLQSLSRQLATLVRRDLAVTVADRLLLAMLVLMPLVLGLLSRGGPGRRRPLVASYGARAGGPHEPQRGAATAHHPHRRRGADGDGGHDPRAGQGARHLPA